VKKLKQIEEKKTKSRSGKKGIRIEELCDNVSKQGEFHSETKQIETETNDR
jgi:hypothetical protein